MLQRSLLIAALSVSVALASAQTTPNPSVLNDAFRLPSGTTPVVEPGRLFIKVKPGQEKAADKAIASIKGKVLNSFPQIGWKSVSFPTNVAVETARAKLAGSASFTKVAPSYRRYFLEEPNDPLRHGQYSLGKMKLPAAWSVTHGDPGVVVCVIDSGFDVTHPDFAGVLLPGKNFGGGPVNDLTDNVGHGTHVAGTVGAATNNGIGIAGNAWGAKILPYKVDDGTGLPSTDGTIKAIIAAGDYGAPICSISIGGYGLNPAEEDAINYSSNKGTLFIVAAGNDFTTAKSYPGAFEACVAVGASDTNDAQASFSNYGDWVDVAAPGVDILSLWPLNMASGAGTGYNIISGTSMATPNTSGVAALILSLNGPGSLSREELRDILESTTDPIGDWITHGRVNALNALNAVPTPVVEPTGPTSPTPVEGTVTNVSTSTLSTSDGLSGVMQSIRKSGYGLVGSMTGTFVPTQLTTDKMRKVELGYSVQTDNLTTMQVYLWDNTTGKWNIFKTFSATGALQNGTLQVPLPLALKAMSNGGMKVMLRSYLPSRLMRGASGTTLVDKLSVTFSGRK